MKQVAFVIFFLAFLLGVGHADEKHIGSNESIIDTLILTGDVIDTLNPNVLFSESELNRLFDSILVPFQDSGYHYAAARLERVANTDDKINIKAEITTGPKVRIGRLLYSGLKRSDPATVSRYFPDVTDSLLTMKRINLIAKAASHIDYLRLDMPIQILLREGYTTSDLECNFTEERPVAVTAGGGYVPDSSTGLVWHLDLKLNNLFGYGRRVSLLSQRRKHDCNELRIGYIQPLFWLGPGSIKFVVATRDYRDSFYEFSLLGSYRLNKWRRISSAVSLEYRSVEPVPTLRRPSFSVYAIEHEIQWQTIDEAFNPSSGVELSWSLLYSYRKYRSDSVLLSNSNSAFNETRISVYMSGYQQLIGPLVGYLAIQYTGLETDEVLPPVSELILVGGPGSLRGYRNEQYAVVRTAIFTAEQRIRFDGGYLFGFADGAYLNNRIENTNESVYDDEFFRLGYGVGLAIHNSTRSVKLSLGWNPETSVDQARLSIELSSEI